MTDISLATPVCLAYPGGDWKKFSPRSHRMMPHRKLMLGLFLLPHLSLAAHAEPLPLPPAYQAKVNQAMLRGMIYLKNAQGIDGSWALAEKPHRVGYAALPGLTLLECGMPGNHSVVQKAAAFISEHAAKEENTYDLALAIMFLDRLG